MRKTLPILGILCVVHLSAFGQISFLPNPSWPQVLKQAQRDKKLIFLHLEDNKCDQCNQVATKGFENTALREKYSVNFINVRLNTESSEGKALAERFEHRGGPLSLYLNAEEAVLARFPGSTDSPLKYLELADQAIVQNKKTTPLKELEKKYAAGERSRPFLEQFIVARRERNLEYESLLDTYTGSCTLDTLQSPRVIHFLLKQALPVDSRARQLLYAVNTVSTYKPGRRFNNAVDSLFFQLPYQERVNLNNQIIEKGFNKAVREKNTNLANQVSYFQSNTYHPDYQLGHLMSQRFMKNYYRQTKDTLRFLQNSASYADALMRYAQVDSLRKRDERMFQQKAKEAGKGGSFSFSAPSQWYYSELNSVAWSFWEMARYSEELQKALVWSKASQDLYEQLRPKNSNAPAQNAAMLDTYAHLLYKLGRREEAIAWQTKAVEAQKEMPMPSPGVTEALEKMKAGTLK